MRFLPALLWAFLVILGIPAAHAQQKGTQRMSDLRFHYAFQLPLADLETRFGNSNAFGLQANYQTGHNWVIGVDASYAFGTTVKEDPLVNIRTPEGQIIGNNRTYASLSLRQRSWQAQAFAGKVFNLDPERPGSGIRLTLGGGFMQHWIRLQDDNNSANQIKDDYEKGYDHLTQGFTLNGFLGYQFISRLNNAHFFAGLDLTQGFTKNVRSYNFDSFGPESEPRQDLLLGFKAGYILLLSSGQDPSEIFY